ncbi:MAG: glycosyltransferase family 4 protein [Pseudomonadota bacterium]
MPRLLAINLYYAPESFGGATIVAEQTIARLQNILGWETLVITTTRDHALPDYFFKRYRYGDMNVIAINLPSEPKGADVYRNHEMTSRVLQIARIFRPDVVHCHSVQNMGCAFFADLKSMGIRLAVTLHDCWWLCERQFMINSDNLYCNQWRIDEAQCRHCTSDYSEMTVRNAYLKRQLEHADLLLFPSEFHLRLHEVNGVVGGRGKINKNGVMQPLPDYRAKRQAASAARTKTAFGFVGGPGAIKGADQIIAALQQIDSTDYVLKVVDAAGNLGSSWNDGRYWNVPGQVQFVPPYRQSTMDDFFASIDVLLFPSQWKESFGLTVREALARDVWVIATRAGGVAEDLIEGENADIIPFGAGSQALSSCIERALGQDRWCGYKNAHTDRIRSFDEQALELSSYLRALLDEPTPSALSVRS